MTTSINPFSTINYSPFSIVGLAPQDKFRLLDTYYANNALYNAQELLHKVVTFNFKLDAMKPLRSPVNRSVEFFASKVASGKPVISSPNQNVIDGVTRFLAWSSFAANKVVDIRRQALYGNSFKKIVATDDKVYAEILDPKEVTDFTLDERGFITEIRIDIPLVVEGQKMTHTEYWTLDSGGYVAIWVHSLGDNADLSELGTPDTYAFLAEFGIDFIPIVHTKFRDIGQKYGVSCVEHCILKIDEANRQATRLHQTLFRYNKPQWAVSANAVDKDGRPMPPPKIKDPTTGAVSNNLTMEDNSILYLPGNSSIDSLIPNVNYGDALAILKSQEDELAKDLPELLYYEMTEKNTSGIAMKLLLAPAIDRAVEAQNNFIQGQVRLNQMALTIGQFLGIFPAMGSFDNGDLDHTMKFADMFELDAQDKANLLKTYLDSGLALITSMRLSGYSEEEITQAMQENPATNLASALTNFNAR